MPISLRISPATRQLLWFVGQIGLVIFVVEAFIMLALSGGDLALGSVLAGLFDATSLTLISSPIAYFWIVRPFVLSAWQANEAVARTAHDLQDALSRLKLQTAAIDRLALISETDARGTIIHANEKFCLTSGYTREELVGRTHALINSGLHPKSFWKDMYATVAKGDVWQEEVRNQAKDGSYYWVRSANVAVRAADGKLSGYLSLRLDVTENKKQQELLKQQKHKLDAQNVQLETALDHMKDGLSMFDAEQRLVACNTIYREIYDLPEGLTQPGTRFSEIVRYFVEKESGEGRPQVLGNERRWIARHAEQLALGKLFTHTHRLSNGRVILVHNQPLAGGGWVDVQEDITEKCRAEAMILHLAHHDALTDIPNRLMLNERLREALARVARGERFAFLLLDLDYFKAVNDTLGHPIGDGLLQAVAERLRRSIREMDTIARMGGDEFALLMANVGEAEEVEGFAQRLIEVIGEPYDIEGHHIVVGTSIGIAFAPDDGETADELIKNADLALYRAKEAGRGTYSFSESTLNARIRARQTLKTNLRRASARGG